MKALKTTLLTGITVVAVAAVPIAQAGNLKPSFHPHSYSPSSVVERPKVPPPYMSIALSPVPPPFKPITASPVKNPPPGFFTGNTNARMVKLCIGWKCSSAA